MHPQQSQPPPNSALDVDPKLPKIKIHHHSSPRHSFATPTPTAGASRKIGVAVDLSDESAYAVRWAVDHYIRPGDAVIILHVSPTSVLYGADWGSVNTSPDAGRKEADNAEKDNHDSKNDKSEKAKRKLEDEFDAFTASKAADLAKPLKDAHIPYKIHIVKDHDMRERLCLEVERLGLSTVIMGSRGFGALKRGNDGKLGSVSDYCVHHCVCPVVVVRYPDERDGGSGSPVVTVKEKEEEEEEVKHLHELQKDA